MHLLQSYKFLTVPFIALLLLTTACAQTLELVEKKNEHHQTYELKTKPDEAHLLEFRDSFTSVVFELKAGSDFEEVFVIDQGDTIEVNRAQHGPPDKPALKSELTMFSERTDHFKVLAKNKRQNFILHLLDAGKSGSFRSQPANGKSQKAQCSRPAAFPQSDWREGLPEPNYSPIEHEVKHAIIHHSAGNTQNSDTRSVVRNIYLNHTEVNGWSDIGYNFLVGINGQIFEGRDGLGQVEDHRVKGAHFCGKNSNTMGICLIGNYENNNSNEASLQSLKQLLTWKLNEADLDPLAYFKHPENADSPGFLGTIAGHQDGCATLCPGENLYAKIPSLKDAVSDSLEKCQQSSVIAQNKGTKNMSIRHCKGELLINGNFIKGKGQLALYNMQGKALMPAKALNFSENTTAKAQIPEHLNAGIYVAKVQTAGGALFTEKLMIP